MPPSTLTSVRAAARVYRFRIVNVFAIGDDCFSGNPLCVFENALGMSDPEMFALARQFNLTETAFVLPPSVAGATARVRIFKPSLEMPFAGHPILGAAHVVRAVAGTGNHLTLDLPAGLVEVNAHADTWFLRVPRAPETRVPAISEVDLAAALGLSASDLAGPHLFVDTGVDQLVVPLSSPGAVHAARPVVDLFAAAAHSATRDESVAYLWAPAAAGDIVARCFYVAHTGLLEDPATGSACANLGGWMLATGRPRPVRLEVHQGAEVERPSRLGLIVDVTGQIQIGGRVLELGSGSVKLAPAGT
jgi:PhzF family phenazine biosynthesis protein